MTSGSLFLKGDANFSEFSKFRTSCKQIDRETMEWNGTPCPKLLIFLVFFRFVTLTYDLWIKACDGWPQPPEMSLIWDQLKRNWIDTEGFIGYTGPQNADFPIFAPWPWPMTYGTLFSERWRKLFWFQLIWDRSQANRPVNEETRG